LIHWLSLSSKESFIGSTSILEHEIGTDSNTNRIALKNQTSLFTFKAAMKWYTFFLQTPDRSGEYELTNDCMLIIFYYVYTRVSSS
jgi:hypothetical protein